MGVHVIKMPDIGEGIAEVELVEWYVKPGDAVVEDQTLADVMTDKATVEVPSPVAGTVLALGGKLGEVMAVGSELIRIEVEGAGNVKAVPAAAAEPPGLTAARAPEMRAEAASVAAARPAAPSAAPAPPVAAGTLPLSRIATPAAVVHATRQSGDKPDRITRGASPRVGSRYRTAVRTCERRSGTRHA